MPSDLPAIRPKEITFSTLPMHTRFPFQYGIASMTELPHRIVRLEVEIDGRQAVGIASEGLPPKWFTKNPATTFEEQDLPDMERAIAQAAEFLLVQDGALPFFESWQALHARQSAWAAANAVPPLLASLGTSLMERALLDALCRHLRRPLHALTDELVDPGAIHPELAGRKPSDFLPAKPADSLIARHTVGLGDPLDASDVTPENAVADGLPYTLEECIAAYGLTHFKIKLCGDFDRDAARLRRLAALLGNMAPGDYRFTLDGNEQYRDIADFRSHWDAHRGDPGLAAFWDHLLFVEQPLHRDRALDASVGEALAEWDGAPPMIIDESDGAFDSLPRALALGYAGTSHKNCKGVVKGIANACLLAKRGGILSGEDLANVGPVALLQDLAVMALLGITHVERNGHHYFRGLSMWPRAVCDAVFLHHGDLYQPHDDGFPALAIHGGRIRIGTANAAPFGCVPMIV